MTERYKPVKYKIKEIISLRLLTGLKINYNNSNYKFEL